MPGEECGSGYMGRVFCVDFYIFHFFYDRSKYDIPTFGRVFIDAHFYTFKHVDS